jgi:hypothetical protein
LHNFLVGIIERDSVGIIHILGTQHTR